jgi:ABC-type branched-subunit amino acid transport system ATPase component
MALLEAKRITAGYGETEILHRVFVKVNEGEIVSIVGPNGAGKSTLLKTILGLLKPREGKVILEAEDITAWEPDRIVRKGICYVPQTDNVFASLTVEENLEMGAFIRKDNYQNQIKEVYTIFPDLEERRKDRAGKLSGGQRQMVAIGRALMLEPKIILLDEPSASLAPKLVRLIFQKITEINRSGVGILMVEQNIREALRIADQAYVLAMGRNRFHDTGQALLNNQAVGKLYLGD